MSDTSKTKRCFIVTPIGDDNDPIRRETDGLISACIEPVLNDLGFEVYVAHTMSLTGSITSQIIKCIYSHELVIANLTHLNPNVMYELAFRHALKKPVITIKEKSDKSRLPFDVQDDRTIFYTNDMFGVPVLKGDIKKFVQSIDFDSPADNPISRAIKDFEIDNYYTSNNIANAIPDDTQYIIARINALADEVRSNRKIYLGYPTTDYKTFSQKLDMLESEDNINIDDKQRINNTLGKLLLLQKEFAENSYGIHSADKEEFIYRCKVLRDNLETKLAELAHNTPPVV